ncbi:MAG: diacylglycerol kinase family protein [Candidatus Andersenbacteria bacterium]
MAKSRYNINSLKAALQGLGYALRHELNFRIEVGLGVLAVLLGAVLGIGLDEWFILMLMIGLVLSLELVNTGFERLSDVQTPHFDPQIKIAKDVSAAAVLVASVAAAAVGFWLFIPRLLAVFGIL